jgi:CheY-like chemotaxis protein
MRSNRTLRNLIVVILSSSASDDDINKAYALGANGYLVKPFSIVAFVSIVQSLKDFWLTNNYPPNE